MKATFSVLAALVLVSQAYAQQYVDQYGNPVRVATAQKAVQYDEATNTVVEVTPTNTQSVNVQQTPIVLQQPVYQQPVYQAPVTVVEGKHLKDSKADSLRKARTDMETDTEQKIVEKLEEARMRDEAARAEKLFGGAGLGAAASASASSASASATATAVAAPAPAPVMAQPVAPPTVEVVGASAAASSAAAASGTTSAAAASAAAEAKLEVQSQPEQVDVKSEIRAALDEREAVKRKDKQQLYVGALAGMSEYPDVINMKGNGSTGFSVGVVTKNRVIVEGSFQYSNYDIEDLAYGGGGAFPVFRNLDQYNTSAGVKFQILPGSLRPFLGGLVSYTRRTYSDQNGNYNGPNSDCSTQAVDVGVTAGADMMISDNFAIGADFKYMTNVTSRQDSNYKQSLVAPSASYGSPVEDLQYYSISLAGKFLF